MIINNYKPNILHPHQFSEHINNRRMFPTNLFTTPWQGPAPSVEDCDDVIAQFSTLTTDIDVKLVEGCYQIVSGNCTGLVCPQRPGESRIPGAEAAKYMATPIRDECIAKGQRGWWSDGTGWGVGVYLA